MSERILTQEELKYRIKYNPETGEFFRLNCKHNSNRLGVIKNALRPNGYFWFSVNDKKYAAHRLAFLYMLGYFPESHVDHINNIRHDNRWGNLREATPSQNNMNKYEQKNNKSGQKGVSWCNATKKWRVLCRGDGKCVFGGNFPNKKDAINKYNEIAKTLHGAFFKAK